MQVEASTQKVKNILYRNVPWKEKRDEDPLAPQESQYLLKYFPKYYKKLSLLGIRSPLISKLKRVKRLHCFQFSSAHHNTWDILSLIFGNKMRDVQVLPEFSRFVSQYSWGCGFGRSDFTEAEYRLATKIKLKFFSKLHKLDFFSYYSDYCNEGEISRSVVPINGGAQGYLNGLCALKHLKVSIARDYDSLSLITKLNSIERVLASLHTFKLVFELPLFNQQILDLHIFWKYLSHLIIDHKFNRPDRSTCWLLQLMQVLPYCENLSFVSVELMPSESQPDIYANFFQHLFQRRTLRALRLELERLQDDDLSRCLQEFSLPPYIKDLELILNSRVIAILIQSNINSLYLNSDLTQRQAAIFKLYERNKAYNTFYMTCKNQLSNLDSLSFIFRGSWSDFENNQFDFALVELCFMAPLLKNISSLASFQYKSSGQNDCNTRLNLSLLLDMVYPLRSSLKKLELSPDEWSSFFADFHPEQLKSFSSLSLLHLDNFVLDENIIQFKKVLRILPETSIQSEDNYQIHLSHLRLSSNESFRQLLRCLTAVQKIKNLRAIIEVNVQGTDQAEAFEDLCTFIERSSKFVDVSLSLDAYDVYGGDFRFDNDLEKRLAVQQVFKELTINLDSRTVKMKNGKCISDISNYSGHY